jgi:hypothetical protein
MRIPSLALVACGLTTCPPARLTGQICAGSTSFARSPTLVSGGAAVSSQSHGFGVGFTLGSHSAFFGVGIGTTHIDALNGSSFDLDAGAGYELSLAQRGSIQLCPIVSVGHRAGPNQTTYGDYSETDVTAGLRVGDAAVQSTHWRLIPTIGLGFAHSQQTFTLPLSGRILTTTAHGFGVVTFGAGAVFNNTLALVSEAGVPIGLANSSPTFALTLDVSLGR